MCLLPALAGCSGADAPGHNWTLTSEPSGNVRSLAEDSTAATVSVSFATPQAAQSQTQHAPAQAALLITKRAPAYGTELP